MISSFSGYQYAIFDDDDDDVDVVDVTTVLVASSLGIILVELVETTQMA